MMKTIQRPNRENSDGFTLVEMSVVLVIIGLLLGGLLLPLRSQMDAQRQLETRKGLEGIKEALLGYVAANGRFPCPASATSNGLEAFAVGGNAANGNCANFYNGFLPAATLGITPTDANGYALDAYNNRLRYAVYTGTINGQTNPFTATNGVKTATMAAMATYTSSNPLLSVCSTATGITAASCGAAGVLASTTPVVIYSTGNNGAYGGTGTDEAANPNPNSANNDPVFVSHDEAPATAANGQFDDLVTWVSLNTYFNRMIAAGRLP